MQVLSAILYLAHYCAMGSGTVEVLVVDSAAFIRGYQVQNYCKKAVTVKEVISEIKDAKTRQNLQVLPYELELREPRSEAIHHGQCKDTPNSCS